MKIRLGSGLLPVNLVTFVAILVTVTFPQDILRIIFGVPFLLICPGYTLLAALFPRKIELGGIERVALTFGLSIAVVPLIGLLINFTPWGITLGSTMFSVALFVFSTSIVASWRLRELPVQECLTIEFDVTIPKRSKITLNEIFTFTLLIIILSGSLGTLGYVIAAPKSGDTFTEFYILGPEGEPTDYPDSLVIGGEGRVIAGIVNHENKETSYRLQIVVNGTMIAELGPVLLFNEERWEDQASWVAEVAGEDQKVEFLLYKNEEVKPFLDPLYLWVDVPEVGDVELTNTDDIAGSDLHKIHRG